ncbi:MAG: hypothetical protein LR011_09230 [Verrucomicrobia bacterium]|nr:hypothetical protein [Verrucomicrobiota bacterium]
MRGRISISPRDFARLGYLYMNEGRWDGRQIVSRRHVKLAGSDALSLNIPRTLGQEAQNCEMHSIGGGGTRQTIMVDIPGCGGLTDWHAMAGDGGMMPRRICMQRWGHCGQRGMAVLPSARIVVSWNDGEEIHCRRDLGKCSIPGTPGRCDGWRGPMT